VKSRCIHIHSFTKGEKDKPPVPLVGFCVKEECQYWVRPDETFFSEAGCLLTLEKKAQVLQAQVAMQQMSLQARAFELAQQEEEYEDEEEETDARVKAAPVKEKE
jgi:hypothetical protein